MSKENNKNVINPILETEFRLAKHLRKILHLDVNDPISNEELEHNLIRGPDNFPIPLPPPLPPLPNPPEWDNIPFGD